MSFLSDTQVLERFMEGGSDPRFLALVGSGWKFFASSNGWIFPFRQKQEVTLVGAEPMGGALETLAADLAEFSEATHPELLVFAAVSRPMALALGQARMHKIRTGTDSRALVPLEGLCPSHSPNTEDGLQFEEWDPRDLDPGSPRRAALETFHRAHSDRNLATGKLRFTPPGVFEPENAFALSGMKRYFVLSLGGKLVGLCIVVPIPGRRTCWIRDFEMDPGLPREAAEHLLTGVAQELRRCDVESFWVAGGCALTHGPVARDGERLYLAYRNQPGSGLWPHQALRISLQAVLEAAPPRIRFSPGSSVNAALRLALQWPTTLGVALCVCVPFVMINRGGIFPTWALDRAGVFRGAPMSFSWWARSILGDFLLSDRRALVTFAIPLLGAVAWLERRCGSAVAPLLLVLSTIFSPIAAQVLFLWPLRLAHPSLFAGGALGTPSVGGEWMLSSLLGFAFGYGVRRLSAAATARILALAVWVGVLLAAAGSPDQSSFVLALVPIPLFVITFALGINLRPAPLKSMEGSLTLEETKTEVSRTKLADESPLSDKLSKDRSQTLCSTEESPRAG